MSEFISRHKELMLRNSIPRFTTDIFYVFGQSNAAGTTPAPNPIPFSTSLNTAWGANRHSQGRFSISFPFRNGNPPSPKFGQSSFGPWFAERWRSLTGRSSLWAPFAIAGQCLVPESVPGVAQYWAPHPTNKSLVGDYVYSAGGDVDTRCNLLKEIDGTIFHNPVMVKGKKIVIWVQGEQDVEAGIKNSRITSADYERELNNLFDYCSSNFGIEYFGIVELGRKGTTAQQISDNEPHYQEIRNAQIAVANKRMDTIILFTGCKETGSLILDVNEEHISGFEYQPDGVHYTEIGYRTIGYTGARSLAGALGYL